MGLTFLDTDVLIQAFRPNPTTLEALARLTGGRDLATTSINVGEFLRGTTGGKRAAARGLLEALQEIPFGPRAAVRFADVMHGLDRAGKRLDVADGQIAAVVLEEGGRLVTGNVRHFGRVPGLDVVTL